jgi:hypothetical protein
LLGTIVRSLSLYSLLRKPPAGRSRIGCDHRLRQRGTFSSYRCSFSRCERENEQQKRGSTMLPQAPASVKRIAA